MEENKPFQVVGVKGKPGQEPHMVVVLTIKGETITTARYSTYGCPTAEVCGQWVCDQAEGLALSKALYMDEDTLVKSVGAMPLGREHCPGLAVSALNSALINAHAKTDAIKEERRRQAEQSVPRELIANTSHNEDLVDMVAQEVMNRLALRDKVSSLADQAIARMAVGRRRQAVAASGPESILSSAPGPRKLILESKLSPGDIIMLTAAVRDLHLTYPGQFITDVRTTSSELWENNPFISPLSSDDPDVETIKCEYPLIHQSNQTPHHFIHAYRMFLNETLGINIQAHRFQGDIHLRQEEKDWLSQVDEITGQNGTPFWIIVSGGKNDFTNKWWDPARYQKIVDHFRERITFVQVGDSSHIHPQLDGVINLLGKTDIRQMVRLMYHAEGVVCGVTMLMHLAAAVETKPGRARNRPCVVIAGGREPVQWEAYPHHQYLHTNGALPCCDSGGCWKSRIQRLGDGDERDQSLCERPVTIATGRMLPQCMDLITADDAIRAIELYLNYNNPAPNVAVPLSVIPEENVKIVQTRVAKNGARQNGRLVGAGK